jgi:hypothetical protein
MGRVLSIKNGYISRYSEQMFWISSKNIGDKAIIITNLEHGYKIQNAKISDIIPHSVYAEEIDDKFSVIQCENGIEFFNDDDIFFTCVDSDNSDPFFVDELVFDNVYYC